MYLVISWSASQYCSDAILVPWENLISQSKFGHEMVSFACIYSSVVPFILYLSLLLIHAHVWEYIHI